MRLYISILFLSVCCLAYSQNRNQSYSIDVINNLEFINFDNDKVEEVIKKDIEVFFPQARLITNNSEGKFYTIIATDKELKETVFLKVREISNLEAILKSNLIYDIIINEIGKQHNTIEIYTSLEKEKAKNNINKDLYRSYSGIKNPLKKSINITKNTTIHVGNSIYPYLQKQYLSAMDKTLFNSLNILALNY